MANIELQISATADKAVDAINRLQSALGQLSTALTNVDNGGISNLSKSVQELSSAMKSVSSSSTKEFDKMAKGIEKLSQTDTSNMSRISSSVTNMATALTQLGQTNVDKNIINLVNAMNRLSQVNLSSLQGQTLNSFIQQIRDLAVALQSSNDIDANVVRLVNAISRLASAGTSAEDAARALPLLRDNLRSLIDSLAGASTVSPEVATLVNAISQLANAGAKASTTATGLSALSTELTKLITALSRTPQVSDATIRLVQALATLASASGRANINTMGFAGTMSRLPSHLNRSTKATKGLVSAIGMFYARCFLIIRAVKGLWKSIDSAMHFLEVYNYFNAAFGDVAEKAVDNWKEAGYQSAEAYAKSFKDRSLELTKKMTGYAVDDRGNLEATGMKNLGINPSTMMNYQAMYAQMASSMGVASEDALLLSNSLVKLGADLSSMKNQDFETTWKNMASAMTGMSRAVDKYGINIRNAAMQEKLADLGIQAKVKDLSQADKALLRTIIMVESSKYAWGDLANTLDRPRNQVRLLSAAWANMCRTMGSLFMAVVAQIIPYINALLIALTRLFQYIAKIFGIEIPTVTSQASSGMEDLGEGIGDVGEALDDANGSAKKLKGNLLGIDELNVINSKDDSGSVGGLGGLGGALSDALKGILDEYDKVWDDAFDKLRDKVNEWVDKLMKYFKRGDFFGLGRDISKWLTNALNSIDWDSVYKVAKNFGKGLAEFLNGLITPDLFGAVGRTIAGALNTAIYFALSFAENFDWVNLGNSLAHGLNEFFKMMDWKALGQAINAIAKGLLDMFITALDNVDWYYIGKCIGDFLGSIDVFSILWKLLKAIVKTFKALGDVIAGAFVSAPIETFLLFVTGVGVAIVNLIPLIGNVAMAVMRLKSTFLMLTDVTTKLGRVVVTVSKALGVLATVFIEFSLVKNATKELANGTDKLVGSITALVVGIGGAIAILTAMLGVVGATIGVVVAFGAAIVGLAEAQHETFVQFSKESIADALANGGTPLAEVKEEFVSFFEGITEKYGKLKDSIAKIADSKSAISDTKDELGLLFLTLENSTRDVEENIDKIIECFQKLVDQTRTLLQQERDLFISGISGLSVEALEIAGMTREQAIKFQFDIDAEKQGELDEIQAGMENLKKAFESTGISQKEFAQQMAEYTQQILDLTGVTSDAEKTFNDFAYSIERIDLSEAVMEDGSVDANVFKNAIDQIDKAYKDAKETTEGYYEEFIQNARDNIKKASSQEEVQYYTQLLKAFEHDRDQAIVQLDDQVQVFSDALSETVNGIAVDVAIDVDAGNGGIWKNKDKLIGTAVEEFDKDVVQPIKDATEGTSIKLDLDLSDEIVKTGKAVGLLGGSRQMMGVTVDGLSIEAKEQEWADLLESAKEYAGFVERPIQNKLLEAPDTDVISRLFPTKDVQTTVATQALQEVKKQTDEVKISSEEAGKAVKDFLSTLDKTSTSGGAGAGKGLTEFHTIVKKTGDDLVPLSSKIGEFADALDDTGKKAEEQAKGFDKISKASEEVVDKTVEMKDKMLEYFDTLSSNESTNDSFIEKLDTLAHDVVPDLTTGFGEFYDSTSNLQADLPNLQTVFDTTFEPFVKTTTETLPNLIQGIQSLKTTFTTEMPQIETSITKVITNVKTRLEELVAWYDETIGVMFEESYWNEKLGFMEETFVNVTKNICNGIIEVINMMIDKINQGMTLEISNLEIGGKQVMSASKNQLFKFEHIEGFMDGGFPQKGNLFMANENGSTEFIGRMGGNPAVANNDQIVKAVSNGVYEAVMSAMSNNESNVNVYLQGDAQGIFKVVREQNRSFKKQTGKSAFA